MTGAWEPRNLMAFPIRFWNTCCSCEPLAISRGKGPCVTRAALEDRGPQVVHGLLHDLVAVRAG